MTEPVAVPSNDQKPEKAPIAFKEVKANGWLVVGDDVFDISRFAKHHPGGSEINVLKGSDATLPLINAHGIRGQLPKLPGGLKVGKIDAATLPARDRDLRALWLGFRERGLFDYPTRWLVLDILRGVALWLAAFAMIRVSIAAAFMLFVIARLNVIWWVHDVCHDEVFLDRKKARFWAELASMTWVGTPTLDYNYVIHRIHHGFTNIIEADQALDTGPVIWHKRMLARSSPRFVAFQAWFWFFVVLPMTVPLFLINAIYQRAKSRDWLTLFWVTARWGIATFIFSDHLVLLFLPVLGSGFLLSLTASLNHFHKPIGELNDPSFARSVARVTQNLDETGPFARWFTGGLNLHIEHHLFSTMPRRNYHLIQPEIKAFFAKYDLPYNSCTLLQALSALWFKLRHPYVELEPAYDGVTRSNPDFATLPRP